MAVVYRLCTHSFYDNRIPTCKPTSLLPETFEQWTVNSLFNICSNLASSWIYTTCRVNNIAWMSSGASVQLQDVHSLVAPILQMAGIFGWLSDF